MSSVGMYFATFSALHHLLWCLLTVHIDDREQSNGGRKPSRHQGICNIRFVHKAFYKESVEDVRIILHLGFLLTGLACATVSAERTM